MDMLQAKKIIAHFLKVEVGEIKDSTVMNHTVVPSSLLLHRMYAVLADNGYVLEDPSTVITYSDFLNAVSNNTIEQNFKGFDTQVISNEFGDKSFFLSSGIDIQEISLIKNIKDKTSDPFFKENFSKEEIEYCMSKPDPSQSFAGLFSVKEAIIKADHSFKKVKFNKINIIHDSSDKPTFEGFSISISHSADYVSAFALKIAFKELPSWLTYEVKQAVRTETKKIVKFFSITLGLVFVCVAIILGNLL
jgi:phosphopantetheine--protein transferase-like protein